MVVVQCSEFDHVPVHCEHNNCLFVFLTNESAE